MKTGYEGDRAQVPEQPAPTRPHGHHRREGEEYPGVASGTDPPSRGSR